MTNRPSHDTTCYLFLTLVKRIQMEPDKPPPRHPSFRLAQDIFGPNVLPYKYPSNIIPVILPAYSDYEGGTECSETSAYKIQMPGNHPKGRIQQSKSCETRGCHRTLSRIIPGSIFDFRIHAASRTFDICFGIWMRL
jgi:hypothetical protein